MRLGESPMRARTISALVVVGAVIAVIASTASGATSARSASSITVWLQVDAQAANWEPIVKAANAQFQKDHPGVTVNVQYQTWGTHLQKLDATLAGGNAPDVIEMGNTEMTKYMAAGAFQDLTAEKASFANSSTWLSGLAASGRYAASSPRSSRHSPTASCSAIRPTAKATTRCSSARSTRCTSTSTKCRRS